MTQFTSSAFFLLSLLLASSVSTTVSATGVVPSLRTSESGMLRVKANSRKLTAPLQLNDDDTNAASIADDSKAEINIPVDTFARALKDSDAGMSVVATLSVTLVNAASDQDIVNLDEGSIVDLAQVGRNLNIRASSNYNFTSMDLWFDGDFVRSESLAPYSLGGDLLDDYRRFEPLTVKGYHKVEVRAKVGDSVVQMLRVGFQVVDQTFAPTQVHTFFPTPSPTMLPSDFPSYIPSDVPSFIPSNHPSNEPSRTPTGAPSDQPSLTPSDQPSFMPSDQPSLAPSDQPSLMPSDQPSLAPSDQPSLAPSDQPSLMPSDQPSLAPSDQPSLAPSDQPSRMPSDQPSAFPSDQPSLSFFAKPAYVKEYFIDAGGDPKRPRYFQANQTQIFRNRKYRVTKTGSYSQKVFQSYRSGATVNYTFPGLEPNAVHSVKLGFAEIYKPNCIEGVGARVMDVTVNGFPFLSDMDVLGKVPCHTAYFEQGMFAADSVGSINIILKASNGIAFVSMIEIESAAPSGK